MYILLIRYITFATIFEYLSKLLCQKLSANYTIVKLQKMVKTTSVIRNCQFLKLLIVVTLVKICGNHEYNSVTIKLSKIVTMGKKLPNVPKL